MRNVPDKFVEKIKTHFKFSNFFSVFEKMWQNIVAPDRPQLTIWRMRIACCIPDATDIHSEYVIIIAFFVCLSTATRAHKRVSTLRYINTNCLVKYLLHAIRASSGVVHVSNCAR